MDVSETQNLFKQHGQEHVFKYWDDLNKSDKEKLLEQLQHVELDDLEHLYKDAMKGLEEAQTKKDEFMEEIPQEIVCKVSDLSKEEKQNYWDIGIEEISKNRVAILLLAGGQGTRLGVKYPKGMYDVGLPSHKTLYQLQAERILKLSLLAREKYGHSTDIRWYIMTSEATLKASRDYFELHSYFGLKKENVIFFEQHLLPCLTFEGKLILSSKSSLALAPDGNGGLYKALKSAKIVDDMAAHNIEHVFVYCVDNILVKVADPIFIGYCKERKADSANKVIEKVDPKESVGIVCKLNGKYQVVEYSEISSETAEKRNEDGTLTFKDSNICLHYFSVEFLKNILSNHLKELPHHVAKKKIPHVNEAGETITPTSPNGIKLEKFVFDVFQFSNNFAVLETERDEEFSPLKNGPSSSSASPISCKQDISNLHRKYLENSGAKFLVENGTSENESIPKEDAICEISPLISYAGEGLEKYNGSTFHGVIHLEQSNDRVSPVMKKSK